MNDRLQKAGALECAISLLVKQAVGFEISAQYHDERAEIAPVNDADFGMSKPWHERQARSLRDEAAWIRGEAHILVGLMEEMK